jgi:hypothetical protein
MLDDTVKAGNDLSNRVSNLFKFNRSKNTPTTYTPHVQVDFPCKCTHPTYTYISRVCKLCKFRGTVCVYASSAERIH